MVDDILFGVLAVQKRLPEFRDLVLLVRGLVAILVVEHFHDLHPRRVNRCEGRKSLGVQERIVLEADKNLGGPRIGLRGLGVSHVATFVALDYGIILYISIAPGG